MLTSIFDFKNRFKMLSFWHREHLKIVLYQLDKVYAWTCIEFINGMNHKIIGML